jgi:hypothetical protein
MKQEIQVTITTREEDIFRPMNKVFCPIGNKHLVSNMHGEIAVTAYTGPQAGQTCPLDEILFKEKWTLHKLAPQYKEEEWDGSVILKQHYLHKNGGVLIPVFKGDKDNQYHCVCHSSWGGSDYLTNALITKEECTPFNGDINISVTPKQD